MAQQLAVSVAPCFKFSKWIKLGDRIEAFSSLLKAKEWIKLYRNHRQVQRCLIERVRKGGGSRQNH